MTTGTRVIVAHDLTTDGPRAIRPTNGHTGTVVHTATTGPLAGRIKVDIDGRGPAWYRAEELAVVV